MIGTMPQAFEDLHRLGHKKGIGLAIATHRLADLEAMGQAADQFFVFRPATVADVYGLYALIGKPAAEWVADAPPFHFWHKGPAGSFACRPIQPRSRRAWARAAAESSSLT